MPSSEEFLVSISRHWQRKEEMTINLDKVTLNSDWILLPPNLVFYETKSN